MPNPFAKIEFRVSFLQNFGYLSAIKKIISTLKDGFIPSFSIKISEIHLHCDIQGYDFSNLDFYRFKTRSRNIKQFSEENVSDNVFYQGRSFQGFSYGSGDYMMRIYNKSKEIKKFPNKAYIKNFWSLKDNYDKNADVFRIEFQLRREKLKSLCIDNQILDGFEIILNNLNNIWQKCLNDFCFLDLSDDVCLEHFKGYKTINNKKEPIKKSCIQKRIERANIHPLWDIIKDFNGFYANKKTNTYIKPIRSDFIYVQNAYKAYLSTLLSHYGTLKPKIVIDSLKKIEEYNKQFHKCTTLESILSRKAERFNDFIISDEDYIKTQTQKEYFLNFVQDIFFNKFEEFKDTDFTTSFYQKLVKKGLIA